jgi:hypothetical protein
MYCEIEIVKQLKIPLIGTEGQISLGRQRKLSKIDKNMIQPFGKCGASDVCGRVRNTDSILHVVVGV